MNLLRRSIRQQQTSGGWIYATVEEFVDGFATVRLASKGARMTMLPVHTSSVEPGERVVVDYSAEGQPYVRPLTALPTEDVEPVAESIPENPEDLGLVAARIGRGSAYPFQTWTILHQIGGTSIRKVGVPWNKLYWESQEGLVQTNSNGDLEFRAPEDGKYLVRWCIGIVGHADAVTWDGNIVFNVYSKFADGGTITPIGGRMHHRHVATVGDGVDLVVASGTTLVHLNPGQNNFVQETIDALVQVEIKMPVNEWWKPQPWYGRDTGFAYKEGCYPILDIWKVAQTGDVLEANYDHIWWQYW
jgi:hypothetical protein